MHQYKSDQKDSIKQIIEEAEDRQLFREMLCDIGVVILLIAFLAFVIFYVPLYYKP